jgi:hypothetical protein
MNEPVVPGEPMPRWTNDAALDGLHFIQHLTRDRAGRAPGLVARTWALALARAVREADPHALVTVGQLPAWSGIETSDLAPALDFASVHLYPASGHEADAAAVLARARVGKPVVVEELGPIACSVEELEAFVRAHRADASGWLSFYWGDPPEVLAHSSSLGDALELQTLRLMERLAPRDPAQTPNDQLSSTR